MKHLSEGLIKQRGVVKISALSRDDLNEYNICETKCGYYYMMIESPKNLEAAGFLSHLSGVLYNKDLRPIYFECYDKNLVDIKNPSNNIVNIWKPDKWMINVITGWIYSNDLFSTLDHQELKKLINGKHYTKIS